MPIEFLTSLQNFMKRYSSNFESLNIKTTNSDYFYIELVMYNHRLLKLEGFSNNLRIVHFDDVNDEPDEVIRLDD